MDAVRRWFATASLPVKVFMGIGVISGVVVFKRSVITPHFRKKRYQQAEEWANMILEQEEKESDVSPLISPRVPSYADIPRDSLIDSPHPHPLIKELLEVIKTYHTKLCKCNIANLKLGFSQWEMEYRPMVFRKVFCKKSYRAAVETLMLYKSEAMNDRVNNKW